MGVWVWVGWCSGGCGERFLQPCTTKPNQTETTKQWFRRRKLDFDEPKQRFRRRKFDFDDEPWVIDVFGEFGVFVLWRLWRFGVLAIWRIVYYGDLAFWWIWQFLRFGDVCVCVCVCVCCGIFCVLPILVDFCLNHKIRRRLKIRRPKLRCLKIRVKIQISLY